MVQTILGLDYLHKINIIHKDIKLENILMKVEEGELIFKIADFGCVTLLGDKAFYEGSMKPMIMPEVGIAGTPHYMAPEMHRALMTHYGDAIEEESKVNQDYYGPQLDTFSLGVTLYALFGGKKSPY